MVNKELFEKMKQSIINGDKAEATQLAKGALEKRIDPLAAIDEGFIKGIEEVGECFEREEIYLPELVMGAEAMMAAAKVLEEVMKDRGEKPKTLGKALAGTIEGDIHDIGKNIVCTFFTVNGFDVVDLGVSVPSSHFVDKVKELKPDFVLLSALLTTILPAQKDVIDSLKRAGIRENVKVLVGGAPVSPDWANQIGADGYGENAIGAVDLAKKLIGV